MQMSVDGFVAGPEGQLDWMTFNMDPKLLEFITKLTDDSDTILMGRKMAKDFITYWESALEKDKDNPEAPFAKKMVDIPKVIFSKTTSSIDGKNARVERGDLKTEVMKLKQQPGKDIVVYGGANFVSSLVRENLIDDYYLFYNPTAIGKGLSIFHDRIPMKLVKSTTYESGIVVNHLQRI